MVGASASSAVVVGVDGSGTDGSALAWAAGTALAHGVPLHLVHATEALTVGAVEDDPGIGGPGVLDAVRRETDEPRVARAAEERVRREWPDLEVVVTETVGSASGALLEHQDDARMIVVGSGRKGMLGQLLLGTTSLNVAMHARCPVAVVPQGVRTDQPPRGRVLVAVDGSRDSAAAALVAWAEAAVRKATVVCVTAWYLEVVRGYVVTEPDSPEWQAIEERQRQRVEAATAAARAQHPDVPVEVEVAQGPSSRVLVERTGEADLLVMGSRGRGGFAGKLLGSVSHKVLQAARSPVIVVKPRKAAR